MLAPQYIQSTHLLFCWWVACLVLNFPLGLQNVNYLRNGGEHQNYCHNLALMGFQG